MPNKQKPDFVNDPVDIAVELARRFEDGLLERLGVDAPPDPVKQWFKENNVRLGILDRSVTRHGEKK